MDYPLVDLKLMDLLQGICDKQTTMAGEALLD